MMPRSMIRNIAMLAVIGSGLATSQANAGFVGSFGLNANSPMIAPGDSLAAATTFSVSSMSSNGNTTGGFSGIGLAAGTPFSDGSFTLGVPTGFTFGNGTFGTFTETAAPTMISQGVVDGVVQSETFLLLGNYAGGPVGATATPSSFTVAFTQDGGPGNSVSASGTLTIPPAGTVPEPASVIMLGIGLVTVGGIGLRRRMVR